MGDVRIIKRGAVRCDQCGFSAAIEEFPVNNEQHTCPRCGTDESGLVFHPSVELTKFKKEARYQGVRYDPLAPGYHHTQETPSGQCQVVNVAFEYVTPCSLPAHHDGDHDWDYANNWASAPWEER